VKIPVSAVRVCPTAPGIKKLHRFCSEAFLFRVKILESLVHLHI
jgi:hypothetical protein